MSKLSKQVKRLSTQGNLAQATVVDVLGDKASVRLSRNGARLTGLTIVGGQTKAGETVLVDFSGTTPVVMVTNPVVDIPRVRPRKPSRTNVGSVIVTTSGSTSGSGLSYTGWGISLFHLGQASMFEMSSAGLTSALSQAASGDGLFIPDGEITVSPTVPAGLNIFGMSRYGTKLIGSITMQNDSSLERMSVVGSLTYNGTLRITDVEVQGTGSYVVGSGSSTPYLVSRSSRIINTTSGSGITALNVSSGTAYLTFTDLLSYGGADINAVGIVYTYGCSYNITTGSGLVPLMGDRAAWDVDNFPTKHASDIYYGAYRYHLPLTSGSAGKVVAAVGDGTYELQDLQQPTSGSPITHAITHGETGGDEVVYVNSESPTATFPGMLWLEP